MGYCHHLTLNLLFNLNKKQATVDSVINTGRIITVLQTGSPSYFAQAQGYQDETHFRPAAPLAKTSNSYTQLHVPFAIVLYALGQVDLHCC